MLSPKAYLPLLLAMTPFPVFAAGAELMKQGSSLPASGSLWNWSFGLLIVLAVFFLCIWLLKRVGNLSSNPAQQMKILSGLSLGMREKIVLLQVGKKQLILGVTPGRIEKLHVLENDDCLPTETANNAGQSFSAKLRQAMKGQADE